MRMSQKKWNWPNEDKNRFCKLFKCSLNYRAHALQSELNKVSIILSNFVRFRLQSMSSKIKQAIKKITKKNLKNRAKQDINQATKRTIYQCKIPYMRKKTFFCKSVWLYIINNLFVVLEIIISKFSYNLKIISRNTFP